MGSWFQSSMNVYSKLISMYLTSWCFLSSIWTSYLFYQLEFDDFLICSIICFRSIGIDGFLICSLRCTCIFFKWTCIFLNELLHSVSFNKLVLICTSGQISVVQPFKLCWKSYLDSFWHSCRVEISSHALSM